MAIYLGENIRRLRREKGVTQETLADFLGVTFQSVSRWEREEGFPDIALLPSIASFFGISVDDLLGVCEDKNEQKINEYIELYETARLKDLSAVLDEYEKAVKEFPGDFRIAVRYMQMLHEVKIRTLSLSQVLSGEHRNTSERISEIYNNIQKYCTVDSIRVWSKTVMISHLMWKYDCICNEEGKYQIYDEYLKQADEIVSTLPSICNSREIMASDRVNYYATHKTALEELLFLLHSELFGYCFNRSLEDRITQYESLLRLLDLIYPDGNFGKNSFNRLYDFGHLGYLYHQIGDDNKSLNYLQRAAEYAKELDENSEVSERDKKHYNYGSVYREATASQFIKTAMTEHYPLSDEFKEKAEFKEIIELLS